jgi:hypothetical protein
MYANLLSVGGEIGDLVELLLTDGQKSRSRASHRDLERKAPGQRQQNRGDREGFMFHGAGSYTQGAYQ